MGARLALDVEAIYSSITSFPTSSFTADATEGKETTIEKLREDPIIRRIWSRSDPFEADASLPCEKNNLDVSYKQNL